MLMPESTILFYFIFELSESPAQCSFYLINLLIGQCQLFMAFQKAFVPVDDLSYESNYKEKEVPVKYNKAQVLEHTF